MDFHVFLGHFFKPEEIEPLEVWQKELANQNPDVRYILIALRDPKDENKLVSAAYGSVQKGILAFRFILTKASHRAPRIVDNLAILGNPQKQNICFQKNLRDSQRKM
ncbi:hypothetical protein HY933_00985 [Candidatus Falkowbacteria bacterium]|nr:hypothetical protein [Candidatus Falkowbacteria bacterium]